MALPATNITTTMVRNELGASTNSVGALCTHPNINMWSKRKPVRDTRLTIPLAEVGKAGNNSWGINTPIYDGSDTALCEYAKPRGGASEPYRMGDFRGYNHEAINPVITPFKPEELIKAETSIALFFPAENDPSNISVYDLYGSTLYAGVELFNPDNNVVLGWGSGEFGITVDLGDLIISAIGARFFLTDVQKDFYDANVSHTRYAIPRAISGENQNWDRVPLKTSSGGGGDPVGGFIVAVVYTSPKPPGVPQPYLAISVHPDLQISDNTTCQIRFSDGGPTQTFVYHAGQADYTGSLSGITQGKTYNVELYVERMGSWEYRAVFNGFIWINGQQ